MKRQSSTYSRNHIKFGGDGVEVYEIIESVDILEYISQFCDPVEKEDGEYWCLSPLKDERTPSFSINTEMQKFYDFSSGKGGNVLDFICAYHNCGFLKGLDILKRYAGITDDEQQTGAPRRLAATTVAKKFQVRHKKEKQSKTSVLQSDYMNRYEWDVKKLAVWEREGISMESMAKFQVRYDPFSDRLVYPIRDVNGNIISVCGRTLDPHYKEKNLRKYTYFQSLGTLDTIYGLSDNIATIRAKGEIILFEGAKSVMMADGWGIQNTGAVLTSHLNDNQFKILIKLGVAVTFALDAEINIREDANIMKLRQYANVYWVRNKDEMLEPKDSPTDKGREVFETLYQERRRLR